MDSNERIIAMRKAIETRIWNKTPQDQVVKWVIGQGFNAEWAAEEVEAAVQSAKNWMIIGMFMLQEKLK